MPLFEKIDAPILPHMGWNTVNAGMGSSLFQGVRTKSSSYGCIRGEEKVGAVPTTCTLRSDFLAAVEDRSVAATQFHPENCQRCGFNSLRIGVICYELSRTSSSR
jgi:glutamine amidotransferase